MASPKKDREARDAHSKWLLGVYMKTHEAELFNSTERLMSSISSENS